MVDVGSASLPDGTEIGTEAKESSLPPGECEQSRIPQSRVELTRIEQNKVAEQRKIESSQME